MKRIFAFILVMGLMLSFAAGADSIILEDSNFAVYSFNPSVILNLDTTDESEENLRKIAGALIVDAAAATYVEGDVLSVEDIASFNKLAFALPYVIYESYSEQLGHAGLQVYLTFGDSEITCYAIGDGTTGLFIYNTGEGSGTGTIVIPSGDATSDYTDFFEGRMANNTFDRYYQIDLTKVTFDDLPLK